MRLHAARFLALFLIAAVSTVWIGNQLILQPSCNLERERIFRAEQQIYRLESKANSMRVDRGTDGSEFEHGLRRRVSDLEQELAKQRHACGKSSSNVEENTGFHNGSVSSLQNEVIRLRSQVVELQAKLRDSVPGSLTSTTMLPLSGFLGGDDPVLSSSAAHSRISVEDVRAWAAADAIGVVVISCKRPVYLKRAMTSFLRWRSESAWTRFPIIISQDGDDATMTQMIESTYIATGLAFHLRHKHEDSAERVAKKFNLKNALGYVRIAQHYGFAMRQMFDDFDFRQVIFLEEDMEVAPDFFSYFSATLPLLRVDTELFCVSAWNDNGGDKLAQNPRAIFRTDFFPGLGWMMRKSLWVEIRDRWAEGFWDEFMRRPDVRRERHCIRPEVSRSMTFGEEGTSAGQFYKEHLSRIKLNDHFVDWAAEDLSVLASSSAYDEYLKRSLRGAILTTKDEIDKRATPGDSFRIQYNEHDYASIAMKFGLMKDEKEGIRRTSYRGVIPFTWQGARVYLYTPQWPDGVS